MERQRGQEYTHGWGKNLIRRVDRYFEATPEDLEGIRQNAVTEVFGRGLTQEEVQRIRDAQGRVHNDHSAFRVEEQVALEDIHGFIVNDASYREYYLSDPNYEYRTPSVGIHYGSLKEFYYGDEDRFEHAIQVDIQKYQESRQPTT